MKGNRQLLGDADVSDDRLTELVARSLGVEQVEVTDIVVEPVPYDLPAITTRSRHWVSGQAVTAHGVLPFRIFVKQVQCWSRSSEFEFVPAEIREFAAASVPWRTEGLVYRSDLATRLPDGLTMPRALGVFDVDESSNAIWMEEVPLHNWPWDSARYRHAAYLLGRLAGSERVAPLATVGAHHWSALDYVAGRLTHQVLPMLRDDDLWRHPLLIEAFRPDLRARMLAAADRVPVWAQELAAAPHGAGHGDACPNNLLGSPDPDAFVLIDFGFWQLLPLGFDLAQLLLGDVQIGRRTADSLAEIEAEILPAYVRGLADEGRLVDQDLVGRLHALQMMVFSGLSIMPFEHLAAPPSADLIKLARDRATIAEFCLDLVEQRGG